METENWRPVFAPFSERYEVSDRGNVRRRWNGKPLKLQFTKLAGGRPGYVKVVLTVGELVKFVSVHRLVACAFVPGDCTLDVNHRDLDKTNNVPANLEWVTHSENTKHGLALHPHWLNHLRQVAARRRRSVVGTNQDGACTSYPSVADAGRALGDVRKGANVKHAIDTGRLAYGQLWRYA